MKWFRSNAKYRMLIGDRTELAIAIFLTTLVIVGTAMLIKAYANR